MPLVLEIDCAEVPPGVRPSLRKGCNSIVDVNHSHSGRGKRDCLQRKRGAVRQSERSLDLDRVGLKIVLEMQLGRKRVVNAPEAADDLLRRERIGISLIATRFGSGCVCCATPKAGRAKYGMPRTTRSACGVAAIVVLQMRGMRLSKNASQPAGLSIRYITPYRVMQAKNNKITHGGGFSCPEPARLG